MTPAGESQSSTRELPLWENDLPVLLGAAAPPDARFPMGGPLAEFPNPATRTGETAEATLENARAEATHIIAQARREAELACEAAVRNATDTVAQEQAAAFERLVGIVRADLEAQFQAGWQELELDAARLCAELAERVVRSRISEDDQVVVETVREGLARMVGAKDITVRVSPECEAALDQAREGLVAELPASVSIQIATDQTVSPGGALLQGNNGQIDLRVEGQLERLREAAEAAIAGETEGEREP